MLGVGDMVLPGLFLCFLYRYDKFVHLSFKQGFFLKAWIGYAVGLISTLLAVVLMNQGQPALFFLVPCTLIPTVIFAYFSGHLKKMWQGMPVWGTDNKRATSDISLENTDNNSGTSNGNKNEEQEERVT